MLTLRHKGEALRNAVPHSQRHTKLQIAALGALGPVTSEEVQLLEKLDLERLPRHVAVIMDGNGRWAQRRHRPPVAGHRKGVQSARTTIKPCPMLHIPALTLHALSPPARPLPTTRPTF